MITDFRSHLRDFVPPSPVIDNASEHTASAALPAMGPARLALLSRPCFKR
jgi:hypothetical protein